MHKISNPKCGYSIAEALVTLFIVALVFVIMAPSISGRKPKLKNYFHSKHGAFYCPPDPERPCVFDPPKDVKDIFVIAVGGGGGGAGAYCSSETNTYKGAQDKDVTGKWDYTPMTATYIEASGSSGGSYQGNCAEYPGGDYVPTKHAYDCNNYPNAYYYNRNFYCKQGNERTYNCRDIWDEALKKWVEKCDTYSPSRYYWSVAQYDNPSKGSISCNFNNSYTPNDCKTWQSGNLSNDSGDQWNCYREPDFIHDFYKGVSVEDAKYESSCSTPWLLKPEVGQPNRGCNKNVYGGRGGSGEYYNKRVCPVPVDSECIKMREAHSINTGCTAKQKAQGWGYGPKFPANKQCGHNFDDFGCTSPHKGAVGQKCVEYSDKSTKISFKIAKPGTDRGGSAMESTIVGYKNLAGGVGGKANTHGYVYPSGVAGGGHTGMSEEYSTFPANNTKPGSPGYVKFTKKYIEVGGGGGAGKMKAGYFKNVKGPVTITVGQGGLGGKAGAVGGDGGTTIVKAAKGGFSISNENTGGSGAPPTSGGVFDPGMINGVLFSVEGGAGGDHTRYYEVCFDPADDNEEDPNKHDGGGGDSSKVPEYGGGGAGKGGIAPDCEANDGDDGKRGGVIIFY